MDPSTGDSSGLTTYWGPIEAAAGMMDGCDLEREQERVDNEQRTVWMDFGEGLRVWKDYLVYWLIGQEYNRKNRMVFMK